ncbi:glutathione S-transferase family protein [Novosphingobium beihaiensis]|uniref:Glutathione S-transferase family protein n=1 Tax=Novosphingobium beihaiensis TaxID=2930389 RepID=A0ABT0BRC8_9SPHN|nr:glutathione S-transferase family protein [Novosphingobium beihaiensis]MCJ2187612.1 glutathione S-transferase family protein [Novosphingobium beihaiensis]
MKLELYTTPISPYARTVEIQLAIKGVEFTRIIPERAFVREGGFGDLNPLRKIPVLMLDGKALPETQVICETIEDLFPEPSLLPGTPMERSLMRLLMRTADIYIAAPSIQLLNMTVNPYSEDVAALAAGTIEKGLAALETWIAPGPYAAGNVRSLADCAIAPFLFLFQQILPAHGVKGLPEAGPKLTAYLDAVRQDEHVGDCMAGMEAGLQERMAAAG